jgi:hypothetical protein
MKIGLILSQKSGLSQNVGQTKTLINQGIGGNT